MTGVGGMDGEGIGVGKDSGGGVDEATLRWPRKVANAELSRSADMLVVVSW